MIAKQYFALFFTLMCAITILSAQEEKGTWQFGIGAGANLFRYPQGSLPYTFFYDRYIEAEQENSIGYQGNFAGSYRIHRILQLHGAVGVSKVKAFTTVNTLSLIDSLNTHEIIDQQYLMLEVPVYLRIHLRQNRPQKYGMHLFLELGLVYYMPIVNNSNYQRSENGVLMESKSIGMRGITRTGGIGLAFGTRNTLAFNFGSYKNQMPKFSSIQRLTFTHFFNSCQKDTESPGE